MGLVCDYTLCDRLPALPDWLSGDCNAVVHGLRLQLMLKKVMGKWALLWSFGTTEVLYGLPVKARGVQKQQSRALQAEIVNRKAETVE